MKSLRFFIAVALALAFSGCTDSPSGGFVGKTAPEFTIRDSDRTVSLRDYRGKIVLLNLWASWCPPCVAETPSLIRLQKRMGDKLVILGVSMDESDAAYHKFLKDYNVDYLTVRDVKQDALRLYSPTGPPETYVIDRSGIVRRKFIGPYPWDSDQFLDYLNKL